MKKALHFRVRFVWAVLLIASLCGSPHSTIASPNHPSHDQISALQSGGTTTYLPVISRGGGSWPMAGANEQRTSWTPEQVDGMVKPLWYKQFEPYIDPKVQVIAANGLLYISTSAGLYALDANTGAEKWVYATRMPLGHSPTIYKGVAYVGGLDSKLHAVDAASGAGLWKFTAGAGFTTSPLVINDVAYIGSRDGFFYAIHTAGLLAGQLAWKFKTDGPIDFSAAYADGIIYFASNDNYAYALDTQGNLVWKSDKLPGSGFHSWWPVVYRDWVIFPGTQNFPKVKDYANDAEVDAVAPYHQSDPRGTPIGPYGNQPGNWVAGTKTMDTSKPTVTLNGSTVPVTEYLEKYPWRRTLYVLNRLTGKEYTTDFDRDGKPEYAPILWQGTHSGNRFPPVVGGDQVLYSASWYLSDQWIPGGQVVGWQIGTPYISIISGDWAAMDEPLAYSAGGKRIYYNNCCDRESGSYDISMSQWVYPREFKYFDWGQLANLIPNYWTRYYPTGDGWGTFGGLNGIYGSHGDQNPPIPYDGKLYMHRSNAVIAFAPGAGSPVGLSMAKTVTVSDVSIPSLTSEQVRSKLAEEINKMISAGHLRPGYLNSGTFSYNYATASCGDSLGDYWHNPAETIYILLRALPYLPLDLQARAQTYIQTEFNAYPPYKYTHIGWRDGAGREVYVFPPDMEASRALYPPSLGSSSFKGWYYDPMGFYALWKYADKFGNAKAIFDASKNLFLQNTLPADDYLVKYPQVNNAYIAGYMGYLELEKLAGYTEETSIHQKLDHLKDLRATTFSKDRPALNLSDPSDLNNYCRGMNVSRNFLDMVPELGQYLHDRIPSQVQAALNEYYQVAPYWFVNQFDAVFEEGATSQFYDHHTLFQAKALILHESQQELTHYLDVPASPVGDLYYIDNLVAAIEAEGY